jgi:hypothetical protein
MPIFVHLAPEKLTGRIRKNGIRPAPWRISAPDGTSRSIRVVFAMPLTRDFTLSHQWLRELKAKGERTIGAVYFKLSAGEEVYVGHYLSPPLRTSVGQALSMIRQAPDARGYQVMIPRRILPREIHRTRALQQGIGWRYWPESHGRKPCPCEVCQRGRIKSQRIRSRENSP